MRDYYARKMAHIHKLAMCIHFSDSDDMTLEINDYVAAIQLLESVEGKMRIGLSLIGRNPLAGIATDVYEFIRSCRRGASLAEILIQFTQDVRRQEMAEILDVLQSLDRISFSEQKYKAKV